LANGHQVNNSLVNPIYLEHLIEFIVQEAT